MPADCGEWPILRRLADLLLSLLSTWLAPKKKGFHWYSLNIPAIKYYVQEAWTLGKQVAGTTILTTPTLAKMVFKRASQCRCELRTKSHPIVICALKFMTGKSKKMIKANRKKADDLKEGQAFVYKDSAGTRLFQTPLIQMLANVMWFANKFDEGIEYPFYFNPFPMPTIALLLTVIPRLCSPLSELANRGATQFDAVIKEYEKRDHSESDGENGCLTEEGEMMAAA
ncbi:hypothetical protein B0H11DRAFT_1941692 [Mycena galericulata]|nr:hypothetical protein B0H11DRAFT_1941692 [Mycena galericulata]